MALEYLDTPELDPRLLVIAGYLAKRISGKCIADINCGSSRILKYLPETYLKYNGNDTNTIGRKIGEKTYISRETDQEFVQNIKNSPVDILLLLGHGAGHLGTSVLESQTLTASVIQIIKDHKPEIIVLEACSIYAERYKVLDEIVNESKRIAEYKITQSISVRSKSTDNGLAQRDIIILEK
jgi:hypothetical protein